MPEQPVQEYPNLTPAQPTLWAATQADAAHGAEGTFFWAVTARTSILQLHPFENPEPHNLCHATQQVNAPGTAKTIPESNPRPDACFTAGDSGREPVSHHAHDSTLPGTLSHPTTLKRSCRVVRLPTGVPRS